MDPQVFAHLRAGLRHRSDRRTAAGPCRAVTADRLLHEGEPADDCDPGDRGRGGHRIPLEIALARHGGRRREDRGFLGEHRAEPLGESGGELRSFATQDVTDQVICRPVRGMFIRLQPAHLAVDFVVPEFAIHEGGNPFAFYHRLSLLVPNSGRNRSAIVSRARKILDRTVPMGQFMIVAISS